MTPEGLTEALTRLAQGKKPYLAITITRAGEFFDAQIIAVHRGKTIAKFGNRLRRTIGEAKEAICHYLNFEFKMSRSKQRWIESEIARLDKQAKK